MLEDDEETPTKLPAGGKGEKGKGTVAGLLVSE